MTWKSVSVDEAFEFVRNGKSVKQTKELNGLPITRIETIAERRVDPDRVGYAGLSESGNEQWLLQSGDILFSHINSVDHIGKCAIYEGVPEKLVHGMNLLAMRPSSQLLPKFALYALNDATFRTNLLPFVNKAVNQASISTTNLKSLQILLPPLDEQKRIAAILDKADALRAKRRQAIALLDRLTQSIFLEMFAGETETRKLAEIASIKSGSTPSRSDADNFGGLIPWVKTNEVKGKTINSTEETVTEKGVKAARLKLFLPGTILMAMYGQGTTRGNVAILGIPATINQACAAIEPSNGVDTVFLFHQLKIKYNAIRSLGRGGNQPNLNLDLVGSIDVVVPNVSAQQKFKDVIERASHFINRQNASAKSCESLFASLQYRAFTGQL
ncbi:restriction endonuclease subunit S [Agrobacterium burrii]